VTLRASPMPPILPRPVRVTVVIILIPTALVTPAVILADIILLRHPATTPVAVFSLLAPASFCLPQTLMEMYAAMAPMANGPMAHNASLILVGGQITVAHPREKVQQTLAIARPIPIVSARPLIFPVVPLMVKEIAPLPLLLMLTDRRKLLLAEVALCVKEIRLA